MGSSCLAASNSRLAASSAPEPNATRARRSSARARPSESSGPASAVTRTRNAAFGSPACRSVSAAANARRARPAGSGVNAAAFSKNADAAARPPRAAARPAECSSSAATSSVGAAAAWARCPGAAFGIGLRVRHVCERAVRPAPILGRTRPVDGRPHQRMTESHPAADLDQAGGSRSICGTGRDAEFSGGAPQQDRLSERLGGGEQQQHPGVARQRRQPPREALLDTARQ